ncbi:MAG: hypothetical protein WCW13_00140 [archaeon]|jgi:hypothetical protein
MFHCKKCGFPIRKKYYYSSGLCSRCYFEKIDKQVLSWEKKRTTIKQVETQSTSVIEKIVSILFGLISWGIFLLLLGGFFYFLIFGINLQSPVPDAQTLTENPKEIILNYTLDSQDHAFTGIAYKGVNDYLASLPREIFYRVFPPSEKDFLIRDLNNYTQREYLYPLVNAINALDIPNYKKVRVAVSLVQNIPYDWSGFNKNIRGNKYPYEVLYTNTGLCGEKSELLAYLLRELGYGVAIFEFKKENHQAVGIKCPLQGSYKNSGYCFIETTQPTKIGNSNESYVGVGQLTSTPSLIEISDGLSYDQIYGD